LHEEETDGVCPRITRISRIKKKRTEKMRGHGLHEQENGNDYNVHSRVPHRTEPVGVCLVRRNRCCTPVKFRISVPLLFLLFKRIFIICEICGYPLAVSCRSSIRVIREIRGQTPSVPLRVIRAIRGQTPSVPLRVIRAIRGLIPSVSLRVIRAIRGLIPSVSLRVIRAIRGLIPSVSLRVIRAIRGLISSFSCNLWTGNGIGDSREDDVSYWDQRVFV